MKKYTFSIISIISTILLFLGAFTDVTNIYNTYIINFFDLMSNEYVIYILSFISISCSIISFKKYKEQIISLIVIIFNIPLVFFTLIEFIINIFHIPISM